MQHQTGISFSTLGILHSELQHQHSLTAFHMQQWITATLKTGCLPTEGGKMLI